MRRPPDISLLKAVASEIRSRRALLSISQEELAARAGLNRTFIGKVELASTQLSVSSLFCVASALGADITEFVGAINCRYLREGRGLDEVK